MKEHCSSLSYVNLKPVVRQTGYGSLMSYDSSKTQTIKYKLFYDNKRTSTSRRRVVMAESSCESSESSSCWRLSIASSSDSMSCSAESYSVRRTLKASRSLPVCCCSQSSSICCLWTSSCTCWWQLLLSPISISFSLTHSILYTITSQSQLKLLFVIDNLSVSSPQTMHNKVQNSQHILNLCK